MMKKIFRTPLIALMFLLAVQVIAAQETRLDSAPRDFREHLAKFASTVRRGDKTAVASMTRFPLLYGFDAGDEGRYTRQAFLRTGFNRIFGPSVKTFLSERNPLFWKEGRDYTIMTEDAAYITFRKTGRTFLLTGYIVEP
jgi:hypothetical protein